MSKDIREIVYITEHILELRHEAVAKFLDVRGFITEYFSKNNVVLPHWQVNENTVSLFDNQLGVKEIGAVVSYDKIVFLTYNPNTKNYFEDKAMKFWKLLGENKHYTIPDILRFGARTKCYIPSNLNFEEINKKIYTMFFNENSMKIIGGTQTDQQVILDLKEQEFQVRIIVGPVRENEASRYFNFKEKEFEQAGIYIDADYYQFGKIAHTKVKNLLDNAMSLFWQKIERMKIAIGV